MSGKSSQRAGVPGSADGTLLRGGVGAALLLGALALFAALALPTQAQQTLEVTRTDDPTPDGCNSGTDCSLREAVIDANADPTDSATIILDDDTYVLNISGTSGDASDGDLVVTSEITVEGAGVNGTTIDASPLDDPSDRVFRVLGGGESPGDLTLEDLTVTGGDASNNATPVGGGIFASDLEGPVSVELLRSRVESNTATTGGGMALQGIEAGLDATIRRSAIIDNTASGTAGGMHMSGGEFATAEVVVDQSLLARNEAFEGPGGAVLNEGGALQVVNSTVSGNTAPRAGGFYNGVGQQQPGTLSLTHVTVARNEALNEGEADALANPAESATARATIIAENPTPGSGSNCTGGDIDSQGQNLEDADTCGFGDSTDLTGTDPDLEDLAQNAPEDPPTRTHALPSDSPAVDKYANNGACDVAEDQREVSRPQDGDQDGTAECDIGAFELRPQADVMVTKATTDTVMVGDEFDYEVMVENTGPDTALDVELTEMLPDEVSVVSVDPGGMCVESTPDEVVECSLGDLADGDSVTVTVTVTADAAAGVVNTAEATSPTPDPDEGNNSDDAEVTIEGGEPSEADLTVAKTAPEEVEVGDEFDYEVVVENTGPDTATDVALTETLPDHVSVSALDPSGDCDETTADEVVECSLGDLASGESVTVVVTVTAERRTSAATNTAEGSTTTDDPNPDNNVDQADVTIFENIPVCRPDVSEDFLEDVTRLSGPGRIATAIQISQESCPPGGAGAVVLTRADIFADALAGTPLATQEDAPLLFSTTDELHAGTAAELQRVLPAGGTVYLLGQTAALSNQVEQDVADLGFNTIRIGGKNRFGTAADIAREGLDDPDPLLIADGGNFPDAVSGAAGDAVGGAVLLSISDFLPSETQAYLDSRTDGPALFAIGGPASTAAPQATPVVGANRFATSVEVAEQFFTQPSAVGIATGGTFADTLAGGPLLGKLGGPMLLTARDSLPPVVRTYLQDNAAHIDQAIVFGGTAAVSTNVEDEVGNIINP